MARAICCLSGSGEQYALRAHPQAGRARHAARPRMLRSSANDSPRPNPSMDGTSPEHYDVHTAFSRKPLLQRPLEARIPDQLGDRMKTVDEPGIQREVLRRLKELPHMHWYTLV